METTDDIKKGLAGVVVDTTAISKVMPESNSLTYRGYPVQDLCEKCQFEQVAYLLINGELPSTAELSNFSQLERSKRQLPSGITEAIMSLPTSAHPMDVVRTGVSMLGCQDDRIWDNSPETNQDKFIGLLAKIPTIIATFFRHRRGEEPVQPDASLSISANFFQMCFGTVPVDEMVKAFDVSLILYAEHSFNASTFTARVIASTTSDMYSAVTGAIGALKGPLHGGANEMVMHMLQEIGEPSKAESWMKDALKKKKKIMGFGHRVYRSGDSRVPTMKKYCRSVAEMKDGLKWIKICDILEDVMVEEKGIYPNLDFPAGPTYFMVGFDIEMFTPIFVMSRITGWCAHIMEQQADNKLIRPLSAYDGVAERQVPSL